MKITSLNVYAMASSVKADGTFATHCSPSDVRHLRRCITGGLIDGATLTITEAGITAIREDEWHVTNREALERLGRLGG